MEFGFLLKKFIGFWLMPLSFTSLFIASGLVLLWIKRHETFGKALASVGLGLLVLLSWNPVGTALLKPIEQRTTPFVDSQQVDFVVVLGSAVKSDSLVPLSSHLSSSARARLLEGLRIANLQPHTKLIVSGYAGSNSMSCAEVYALVAKEMGFDELRIIELREPKDTEEEAIAVKNLVGEKRVALVTSASHMPRALTFFQNESVNAIAAPSFYLAKSMKEIDWRFDSAGLFKSERAIYEYAGLLWQWMKS